MRQETLTKNSIFLLPMFGARASNVGRDFYNSYLSDTHNTIYIVYKKKDGEAHVFDKSKYDDAIREVITIGDFLLFAVNIPQERRDDVEKLLDGKYSKFAVDYKHKIVYVYSQLKPGNQTQANIYNILFPNPDIRKKMSDFFGTDIDADAEVHDIPDLEHEIINFSKLIEQSNLLCHLEE